MDPDHTISVIVAKTHKPVFEGDVRDFSSDKEWKVKRIDNDYSYNFAICVKEIEPKKEEE
jgi:hypothetical protein